MMWEKYFQEKGFTEDYQKKLFFEFIHDGVTRWGKKHPEYKDHPLTPEAQKSLMDSLAFERFIFEEDIRAVNIIQKIGLLLNRRYDRRLGEKVMRYLSGDSFTHADAEYLLKNVRKMVEDTSRSDMKKYILSHKPYIESNKQLKEEIRAIQERKQRLIDAVQAQEERTRRAKEAMERQREKTRQTKANLHAINKSVRSLEKKLRLQQEEEARSGKRSKPQKGALLPKRRRRPSPTLGKWRKFWEETSPKKRRISSIESSFDEPALKISRVEADARDTGSNDRTPVRTR